ncbi:DUF5984 family protein [Streptomyces sp. NPDC052236]|uniref:DUF5984 family protein n=1 Tax=Streptomyces sp. NPDC052236 TaxID=3365686 RepID=UPI0037D23CF9
MTHTDPAIRLRFGLTPLDRVGAWGGERPVLHWFGLTDGWYCIDLGGHEVLRYSKRTSREPDHPYVDYYVVRLWEDMLALVSGAMEPVPPDLADVAAEMSPDWNWVDTPEAEAAVDWHSAGFLYTDYLRVAPHVRCWRTLVGDDDTVTVAWEHQPDPEGAIEFAGPQTGRVTMPTSEFLAAVIEFDRALLAAMDQRISELEALEESGRAAVPGVELDLEQLCREHLDRAAWLRRARDRDPATDWDAVRAGVRMLR